MLGLHNLVEVDMAPALGGAVDDLEGGLASKEFGDIPIGRLERLRIPGLAAAPVGGAHHLIPDA